MKKVNTTALYHLMINKELVPLKSLAEEANTLYTVLKLEGGKHTMTYYDDVNENNRIYVKFADCDIRIRAMAALIEKIIYRWNDQNGRLEHHFGLPASIDAILDLKKLTKSEDYDGDFSYITVRTLVENYTGKKYPHTLEEW